MLRVVPGRVPSCAGSAASKPGVVVPNRPRGDEPRCSGPTVCFVAVRLNTEKVVFFDSPCQDNHNLNLCSMESAFKP